LVLFVVEGSGLAEAAERYMRARVNVMSRAEAHAYLTKIASNLGVDLKRADLEKTRELLSKGTPLSRIIIEMRRRE